ncbi:oligoribonuclease [Corynebacterium glyciniphilum]|uniref:oligoribonuclease n=1 Tax=Corynebacterium glyciniphilum TaxID=1404244 RepID=UPI00264CB2A6|nr:oligoribonuclease [Corynebacterium glyciniphilum]MDN5683504.1 oligoribonuclease [Corynebacterium glyciniphilum]MDN6704560.1 oligoribonuclease [Corynebacterium glyciniphilum]
MTPNQIAKNDRIVWADCEMTGLDPDRHVLVEIAVVVTDADLTPLDDGIDIVIHASEDDLAGMDDFVTRMHADSGLTEQIRESPVSVADAEAQVVEYLKRYVPVSGAAPLAGNSIASDRKFISRYMPDLDAFLHYRMIDVSSIKELARRWYPRAYSNQPDKGMQHRALADIRESIRELDYYRRALFVPAPGPTNGEAKEFADAASEANPI